MTNSLVAGNTERVTGLAIETKVPTFWTPEQIQLIKRTLAPNATNDELQLFLYTATRSGLDPLARQIYFQKISGRPVFITSIDGLRLIASRTGEHAGTDDAVFVEDDNLPVKATVSVYRIVKNSKVSFTATARWDEYCPPKGRDHMWVKMPYTMLAKCAEALALRKGFPAELSGLYSKEELDQADQGNSQPPHQEVKTEPQVKIVNNSKQSDVPHMADNPPAPTEEWVAPDDTSLELPMPDMSSGPRVVSKNPGVGAAPSVDAYKIPFGKYSGKTLDQVHPADIRSYCKFLTKAAQEKGTISDEARDFLERAKKYLDAPQEDVPF